jgi:hypothetical protein
MYGRRAWLVVGRRGDDAMRDDGRWAAAAELSDWTKGGISIHSFHAAPTTSLQTLPQSFV